MWTLLAALAVGACCCIELALLGDNKWHLHLSSSVSVVHCLLSSSLLCLDWSYSWLFILLLMAYSYLKGSIVLVFGILTLVITHSNTIVLTFCNWSWHIKMGQCAVLVHFPYCPATVWITDSSRKLCFSFSEIRCFYACSKFHIPSFQKVSNLWTVKFLAAFCFLVYFIFLLFV